MKSILISVLLLSFFCSKAQQLSDDITDTRKKNESYARFQQKDIKADLATFTLSGIDESVNKEGLRKISFTSFDNDSMLFEGEGIKTKIRLAPFDGSKHKLDYDEKYLIKIDKKPYYGGYPGLPKTYISQVTMMIGKDTILIPPIAYADLYNLNLAYKDKSGTKRSTDAIYLSKDGHKIYIYLFSKDNTGSYEVTWIIQDKKYVRRVLDYDFM